MGCEPIEELWLTMIQLRQKAGKPMTDRIAMKIQTISDCNLLCFMAATSCAHVCQVNFADFAQRAFPLRGPLRGTVSPKSLLEDWGPLLVPLPLPSKKRRKAKKNNEKRQNEKKSLQPHRVLQGAPLRGRQLYFTFASASDPLFKASKAPFLTLRVASPSGASVKHRLN